MKNKSNNKRNSNKEENNYINNPEDKNLKWVKLLEEELNQFSLGDSEEEEMEFHEKEFDQITSFPENTNKNINEEIYPNKKEKEQNNFRKEEENILNKQI